MTQTSLRLIEAAHRQTNGDMEVESLEELREDGKEIHRAIAADLVKCTEKLDGTTVLSVAYAPAPGLPADR